MSESATIERRADDPPIVAALKQWEPDLIQALPEGYSPGRFKSVCINLARANPKLLTCTPLSFVTSVLMAAQLGLEPGPPLGLSWIIPRRNKGVMEASFQIGYEGYRDLAYRSGQVRSIEGFIVYEGDDFEWERGPGGANWRHKSLGIPGRAWTDVYATAETIMGAEMFYSMTQAEVLEHRDRYVPKWQDSQSWREEEDKMARKTCLIQLCRQLPRSVEVRQAIAIDGATPRELAPDLAGLVALERAAEEGFEDDAPEA